MIAVTINPEKSKELLSRHPNFKILLKPFTRKEKNSQGASKNTVSTRVDSSSRQSSTTQKNRFAVKPDV